MNAANVLSLFGGIALFLFGMSLMGDSLKKVAGSRLEKILFKLSGTPVRGIFLGLGVTALIQSSSATSVMVVGFVNSGMMAIRQAIGVIMGAIIGTSVTGWILCLSELHSESAGILSLLSTESLAAIVSLVGIIFYMFLKKPEKKHLGGIMLGFGILMVGMTNMSSSMSVLRTNPQFISLLTSFSSPILGILLGTAVTAVLQSASAAVGILQALAATGVIKFDIALPVLMGIAIGAALPVVLSSIGANSQARKAAWSYLVIAVLGAAGAGILFYALNSVFRFTFMETTVNAVSTAFVNTVYRFLVIFLLAPVMGLVEKITDRIVKDDGKGESDELPDIDKLEERFIEHPSLALAQSRMTINSMAETARKNVSEAMALIADYSDSGFDNVEKTESMVDRYEDKLGSYLVKINSKALDEKQNRQLSKFLHTINDFERISDHALNLAENAREKRKKSILFTEEGYKELIVLIDAIREIIEISVAAFVNDDLELAARIEPLEEVIDDLCDELKLHHIDRIQRGICTLEHGFIFNDMITNFERIADHCSNIGVAMIELEAGNLDLHEYAAGIKQGQNGDFNRLYDEYSGKFRITQNQ